MTKKEPTLIWALDANLVAAIWRAPGNAEGDQFIVRQLADGKWSIDLTDPALLSGPSSKTFDTAAEARAACEVIHRGFASKGGKISNSIGN